LVLRGTTHSTLVLHEVIAEFGCCRDFVLVRHREFGSSYNLILMLVGKLCGIVHVLWGRLVLIVCGRSHLKTSRGILTVVVRLVLLTSSAVVETTTIAIVVGLVVYIHDDA
jgi:hypothetical protein